VRVLGIDDQHLVLPFDWLSAPENHDGSCKPGSVEQVRSQSDDGLDQILFQQGTSNLALSPFAEEGTLR